MSKHICVDIPTEIKEFVIGWYFFRKVYLNYYIHNLLVISNINRIHFSRDIDFKNEEACYRVIINYKFCLGFSKNIIFVFSDEEIAYSFFEFIGSEVFDLLNKQNDIVGEVND